MTPTQRRRRISLACSPRSEFSASDRQLRRAFSPRRRRPPGPVAASGGGVDYGADGRRPPRRRPVGDGDAFRIEPRGNRGVAAARRPALAAGGLEAHVVAEPHMRNRFQTIPRNMTTQTTATIAARNGIPMEKLVNRASKKPTTATALADRTPSAARPPSTWPLSAARRCGPLLRRRARIGCGGRPAPSEMPFLRRQGPAVPGAMRGNAAYVDQ
ncbi:MAG: hypothetical protein QOH57_1609 [Mycobacterium sp.]|nr:hypothetical protein [Mycobacterium sp.]